MMKKNKNIIILVSVIIVIVIGLLIVINPFKFGKLKGSISEVPPANPAFNDNEFYKCVIDNYIRTVYNQDTGEIDYAGNSDYDTYNAKLKVNYDTNLTDEQLSSMKYLSCAVFDYNKTGYFIKSTKGLEKLKNIITFDINQSPQLNTIDISNNTLLQNIIVNDTSIVNVDTTKNVKLLNLDLSNNKINAIDVANNPNLKSLNLSNNKLSQINLTNNLALTSLSLEKNNLSKINIDALVNLTDFNIASNELEQLDVSKNTNLRVDSSYQFNYSNNKITAFKLADIRNIYNYYQPQLVPLRAIEINNDKAFNFTNSGYELINDGIVIKQPVSVQSFITALGLKNLTAKVFTTRYGDTEITTGNVGEGNYVYIYDAPNSVLETLAIYEFNNPDFDNYYLYSEVIGSFNSKNSKSYTTKNVLTDEELKTITSLTLNKAFDMRINFEYRNLKGLEKLVNLETLSLNYLENTFDFSKLSKLTSLEIKESGLTTIDLSKNTSLTNLSIDNSPKLTSIVGLSSLVNLTNLSIRQNKISELNVDTLVNLTSLSVNSTKISELNIDALVKLKSLSALGNYLKQFVIKNGESLNQLDVSSNYITSMDISNCHALQYIDISNNLLSQFTIPTNDSYYYPLSEFFANNNKLTVINGLENITIARRSAVDLYNNNLENIDLSVLPDLDQINLSNNNLKTIKFNNPSLEVINLDNNSLTSIDVSTCPQLIGLLINNNKLTNVIGLDKLTNLFILGLNNNMIETLDIQNSPNIMGINIMANPILKNSISLVNGTEVAYNEKIKLPSSLNTPVFNEDDSIATYSAGKIKGLSPGEITMTKLIPSYDINNDVAGEIPVRLFVKVYDITSRKYAINKENKYIYVGTETNDKAIKRYVKVSGENVNKEFKNNVFKILDGTKLVESYDVIKVSSNVYNLDGDKINYTNTFDLSKINVINGEKVVINNQLQITHNGVTVKTFQLIESGR
ncbi:MAG: hypothetical protein RSA10_02655 [Bacilli bacterium]